MDNSVIQHEILGLDEYKKLVAIEAKFNLIRELHKNAKYGIDDRILDQILGIERKEEE